MSGVRALGARTETRDRGQGRLGHTQCAGAQGRVARQPGGWGLRGGAPLPGWRDAGTQPASVSQRTALSVSHPRVGGAAVAESLPLQAWAQAGPPARAHLSCRPRHPITQQVYKPGRRGTEASLTPCMF